MNSAFRFAVGLVYRYSTMFCQFAIAHHPPHPRVSLLCTCLLWRRIPAILVHAAGLQRHITELLIRRSGARNGCSSTPWSRVGTRYGCSDRNSFLRLLYSDTVVRASRIGRSRLQIMYFLWVHHILVMCVVQILRLHVQQTPRANIEMNRRCQQHGKYCFRRMP